MSDVLKWETVQLLKGFVDLYSDRHFLHDHKRNKSPAMQHTLQGGLTTSLRTIGHKGCVKAVGTWA